MSICIYKHIQLFIACFLVVDDDEHCKENLRKVLQNYIGFMLKPSSSTFFGQRSHKGMVEIDVLDKGEDKEMVEIDVQVYVLCANSHIGSGCNILGSLCKK